jgi:hypothetical protein
MRDSGTRRTVNRSQPESHRRPKLIRQGRLSPAVKTWGFKAAMMSTRQESSGETPVRVLLTTTNRWGISARLAMSLAGVGCDVWAICPAPSHPLMKTRVVRRAFRYSSIRPLESLAAAIAEVRPDIVIPSCDRGVEHLHELYIQAKANGDAGSTIVALIERSLGPMNSHSIVSSRYELLALALEEGVNVPRTSLVNTTEELESWRAKEPFPWVLKADGTWGGGGVRVIRSREGVEKGFQQLIQMFRLTRTIKRLVVNRDPFWVRGWWNQSRRSMIAQSFVSGRPANCAVVCRDGQILGIICVEVVRSDGPTGPANVVQIVDNAEMTFAAKRIAIRLRLSGFFGLDFMIEDGTNTAYLIEMNPRTTPPCHLRLGSGRDLAGALWSQLAGKPLPDDPAATEANTIAYFPQAMNMNQDGLPNCFFDIPQGEPELAQELLHPFPDRTILYRFFRWLTGGSAPENSSELAKGATP